MMGRFFKRIISFFKEHSLFRWFVIIFLSLFLIAGISFGGYKFIQGRKGNVRVFLLLIGEYEDDVILFKENLPKIVSKARSTLHYLMILKRLDQYKLVSEYRSTLARALRKYPRVDSLLALAIEYKLTYVNGDLFDSYLENVEDLWNTYPNLVRLYYMLQYDKYKVRYEGDDILNFYYKIASNDYSWDTLNALWQVTGAPIFLLSATLQAGKEGQTEIVKKLYNTIPLEWIPLYEQYYSEIAVRVADIEYLENQINITQNVEDYTRLGYVYYLQNNYSKAYDTLTSFLENHTIEDVTTEYLHLYLWLISYFKEYEKIDDLIDTVLFSQDSLLERQIIVSLYEADTTRLQTFLDGLSVHAREVFMADRFNQFLLINTRPINVLEQQKFLWETIYDPNISVEDRDLWYKVAAAFFLRNKLLDDYELLKREGVNTKELIPHDFYYYMRYNSNTVSMEEIEEIVQKSELQEYSWWHYYNLGVMKLNIKQYDSANKYLEQALLLVEATPSHLEPLLPQLVRINILQQNFEQAEFYLTELQTLFPTNVFIPLLLKRLEFSTSPIEQEISADSKTGSDS